MAAVIAHAAHWAQRRPGAPQWPSRQRCRRSCRRRQLSVSAGLLDMLRGGGGGPSLQQDAEGAALQRWMEERGLPPQKVAAVAVPGAGRGLAATQPISKGEALLHIPPRLIVTAGAAARQSCLAQLLESSPLPDWSVLALWLAESRAAGAAGEWAPYMALLPEQTGCVLEWSEEEVGWLAGSELHRQAVEIRAAADASWAEMQPLLQEAERQGLGPPGAFSRAQLDWAFAMLLSRLVRLPSLTPSAAADAAADSSAQQQQQQQQQWGRAEQLPGTEALLPFADLLNHSCAASAFLDWSRAEGAVVLQADRRYRPNDEVYISYGQKTSGELLLSYGFCPTPADNPHDGCQLRLSLRQDDPAREWKAAALARLGGSPSQLFPLRMTAAPFDLLHYAGLVAADVSSQEEAERLAHALLRQGEVPPALQPAALQVVVSACQAAIKAYPRSFDEDRAELDALEAAAVGGGGPAAGAASAAAAGRTERRRQVLQVTTYERQVLHRTLFVMQQELRDLRRMARAG